MQYAMRHSDPRTPIPYDMARANLDRQPAYSVADYSPAWPSTSSAACADVRPRSPLLPLRVPPLPNDPLTVIGMSGRAGHIAAPSRRPAPRE
jgi:hypothetical protein